MFGYDEVMVAQVCHAAISEFRFRAGGVPVRSWEELGEEDREFSVTCVLAARAGQTPPRHDDPVQRTAAQMYLLIVTAMTTELAA